MPKIRAAVAVRKGGPLEFRELDLAEPVGNEILVRTVATGICHTDLLLRDQIFGPPLPAIPGHEGVGIVEAIGADVTGVKVGDHVALSQTSCGTCPTCRRAHPMNCDNYTQWNLTGKRANGEDAIEGETISANFVGQSSFATHILATENNAAVLPREFPLENAAPLGCGMATGAGAVLNVMKPELGSSIVVFGCGAVGLAAIMAAKVAGCGTIIAVDLHENRRAIALKVGATHVIDGADKDVVAQVHALTDGGTDFAIDAVGIPRVVVTAVECTRVGGHSVLLGLDGLGQPVPFQLDTLVFNRRIEGAILGDQIPQIFIPQMVALNLAGKFPFETFITHYRFEDINTAIADAEAGRVIKPVLTFA